jgi:hypothetical protein
MELDVILRDVLVPPAQETYDGAEAWWKAHAARKLDPIDAAIAGGARADRVAWAFASGYAAALHAMVPSLEGKRACVAATEEKGAHPRAIQTTLEGKHVRGRKHYVTLGTHADVLLVVAKEGEKDDRPLLRVVRVDTRHVKIVSSTAAPFVPEITHAQIEIDTDGEPLDGDGYELYLKPFRTIEDVHVHAALLAYVGAIGMRNGWDKTVVSKLCALVASARSIATAHPRAPEVHVALGGWIAETSALLAAIDPLMDERWQRDKALFGVASKARAERLARAFERLSGRSPGA